MNWRRGRQAGALKSERHVLRCRCMMPHTACHGRYAYPICGVSVVCVRGGGAGRTVTAHANRAAHAPPFGRELAVVNISTVCASSCVEYLRGAILDTPSRVCARSLCALGCVCVCGVSVRSITQ